LGDLLIDTNTDDVGRTSINFNSGGLTMSSAGGIGNGVITGLVLHPSNSNGNTMVEIILYMLSSFMGEKILVGGYFFLAQ
jgi:hypothetical protein